MIISFVPYKGSQHFFEIDVRFSLKFMNMIPFITGKVQRFSSDTIKGIIFEFNIDWLFLSRMEFTLRLAINTQNKPEQK